MPLVDDTPIEITRLTLADLRADESGAAIEQLAELIVEAFGEPPWHERFSASRIHFGLGVELMRQGALLYAARDEASGRLVGYVLGKELAAGEGDEHRQTLREISGTTALDYLCEGGRRVFYVTGLAVRSGFRRRGIAERLSLALLDELRRQGFSYRLGRTDRSMASMRNLYTKQGFRELPISDANYPERSYWLLAL
jgi:ribosomal protein S18 acetylase RimI-like enzyme